MTKAESQEIRRCAIYARKSCEQGLEINFNSLEAQEEMCAAYIKSQAHRGWKQLPKVYVDAAQSGGTLDRPALQALMADIEAGKIDVVVIYKLDRLSRSLLDFVRMMAVFDRHAASFVCITQNFDTGDSLGRLIMNVLLTFAQFEREITSDRIRDKRRATAARGIWSGSRAPYGYDYVEKRLTPNRREAEIVRWIFRRYIQLGSQRALWRECQSRGIMSKSRVSRDGVIIEPKPIHGASLRTILCNPIYMGDVRNNGHRYPGVHRPLVSKAIWEAAEQLRIRTTGGRNPTAPVDLLPTTIFDSFGRRMNMYRKYRRWGCERYYYSFQTAWGRAKRLRRFRAHAGELEKLVVAAVETLICDRERIRAILLDGGQPGPDLDRIASGGDIAGRRIRAAAAEKLATILGELIARIEVSRDRVKIAIRVSELVRFLLWDGLDEFSPNPLAGDRQPTYLVDVPARAVRLARTLQLPICPRPAELKAKPDPKLRLLISRARKAQALVDSERETPIADLAGRMGRKPGEFMRLVQLNYLAPDIITSILDGTQPAGLKRRDLTRANLPMDWPMQRKLFGFPEQPPMQTTETPY